MTDEVERAIADAQANLSAQPGMPVIAAPVATGDAWSLYEAKQKRERETKPADYLGAMWRQDSAVDGIVAHVIGNQMIPDPQYSAYAPDEWARLTTGISEDFHKEFYAATSQMHADHIRDRLF